MSTKSIIFSMLFASSVLTAPTTSPASELERRADWQEGKCEAHVALNSMERPLLNRWNYLTDNTSIQRA
jgi:hypothetical protein